MEGGHVTEGIVPRSPRPPTPVQPHLCTEVPITIHPVYFALVMAETAPISELLLTFEALGRELLPEYGLSTSTCGKAHKYGYEYACASLRAPAFQRCCYLIS